MLKISFEVTPDLIETVISLLNQRAGIETERLFRQQRKLWYTINKIVLSTLIILILVPAALIPETEANGWWILYFCVISSIFGALAAKPLMNFDAHTLIYSSLGILGEVQIEVSEGGFITEQNGTRSVTPWASYYGVEEEKGLILLLRDPIAANFMPVSAFRSPEDKDLFVQELRRNLEIASVARHTPYSHTQNPETFK